MNFSEVGEEMMDAIVRILHLFSIIGQDPEKLYKKVMDHNRTRERRWNTKRGA